MTNIRYKNINFSYGQSTILHDVSFSVEPGMCCALIGHNGAGKTTLIKLLLGMIKPNAGSVELCQFNPIGKHEKHIKKQIGFVPESINFQPNNTGLQLMQYVAKLKGASAQDIQDKMELTNIAFAQNKKIGAYSKGMKQRLGLAQAMLGNPKVLILDEPASGLDPDSRQILYRSLQAHAKAGNTVMFSSHALNDIESYIDHIILLNEGGVLMNCGIAEYRDSLKLPVMIEIQTTNASVSFYDGLKEFGKLDYDEHVTHITVDYNNKLPALAYISTNPSVTDLRLLDASLETIYHELLKNEEKDNGEHT
ncbi:MAG TPA: ABC transporter ATP-binding protein [Oceanospirillales bacterium]|nr:ABC transporter ATP-binding protein [Oceanospirillales bacterium]